LNKKRSSFPFAHNLANTPSLVQPSRTISLSRTFLFLRFNGSAIQSEFWGKIELGFSLVLRFKLAGFRNFFLLASLALAIWILEFGMNLCIFFTIEKLTFLPMMMLG